MPLLFFFLNVYLLDPDPNADPQPWNQLVVSDAWPMYHAQCCNSGSITFSWIRIQEE